MLKSLPNCHRSVRNDRRLFLRTKQYPVLLRITKYYSSTTKYYSTTTPYYKVLLQYYKVLLQYYSVLQSTTPVLQSTTPVLLRTTKYYSSTTKYYFVLQNTNPVLLRTKKTTSYYKILVQYYSVLQSTTPVLIRTTKYYSSTTPYYKVLLQYYKVLLCTTDYYSSTTLYHKARHARLILITYETSFTMRGATVVPLQPHQILRLSRRKTHMLNPHHIWNLIYNARSNRPPPPTSPNTAPVTQKDSHAESSSHMKPHLQCAEQQLSPSNLTKYCACHAERLTCFILITYETSFTMRGATGLPLPPHQILRLSRRKTHMLNPHHIWNLIYNARSNRCPPPTSATTAPATKNCIATFQSKCPKTDERSFPMRGRSDHDPRMIRP